MPWQVDARTPLALHTMGEDGDCVEEPEERGALLPALWCGDTAEHLESREERRAARKVEFEAVQNTGTTSNFEMRGNREPLRSMGLYHYVMYVYEVLRSESEMVDPNCALKYAYERNHINM